MPPVLSVFEKHHSVRLIRITSPERCELARFVWQSPPPPAPFALSQRLPRAAEYAAAFFSAALTPSPSSLPCPREGARKA